jgi:hypothetical protein
MGIIIFLFCIISAKFGVMNYLKVAVALLIYLAGAAGAVNAQDVLYSQFDKYDFRDGDYAIAGKTGAYVYTYLNTSDGALLNAYDDSMNKVATVLLDFFPEKIYDVHFIAYPDKMIVLYQALEANKVIQYAALLDEKGRLKNRPVTLGSVKTGIIGATRTYYSVAVSDNKQTILIYSAHDKGGAIEFDGKWLDDKLAIVKRSHITFETDNTVDHGEVQVGNDGTVYMATYTPVGALNYANQYWIMTLAPGATKFDAKELLLDGKYAAGGYMNVDNLNGKVYFGGFYSDKKNGSFDGIICAAYDIASGAYSTKRLIPFDQDLIATAGAHHKNHAFDNYEVRQVIPKTDGGFVLVSEVHYVTTRSNYTPGIGFGYFSQNMATLIHEYHYNDIMALSYNKDGVRQWGAYIPKEQYSQEDNGIFSSYVLLNSGGTLAFLFNDFNMGHSHIQLATVASDGKTDIHMFSPEGNDNPGWVPKQGKQVGARELIIPCFGKKQICFAEVVF